MSYGKGCGTCWWREGDLCYQGKFSRDENGRSDKPAAGRCDQYESKRGVLNQTVPDHMLVIMSESKEGT